MGGKKGAGGQGNALSKTFRIKSNGWSNAAGRSSPHETDAQTYQILITRSCFDC
jgi:hypothetical protein